MTSNDRVDIRLIVPDLGYRKSIQAILANSGYTKMSLGRTLEDVHAAFSLGTPDLLIMGAEFPEGDPCELIQRVRQQEVGHDMFLPIIAVCGEPKPTIVKKVVDSGADDMLVQPFSTKQLCDRIDALVHRRKPYVVTSSYIGPDRRSNKRNDEGKEEVPLIEVPNMLRARVVGDVNPYEIQKQIKDMAEEVNLQRLERYGVQIMWLVERLVPAFEAKRTDDEVKDFMRQLRQVSEDARFRMMETEYAHVSDLCKTMIRVTNDIMAAEYLPSAKDIKLLTPVAQAIKAAFADRSTSAIAREIAETMN